MQQPARFLFAACLTTIVVAGSSTAAESEAPAQVLVNVDTPDQVMTAHWMRLPDAYVLRVVFDEPQPAPPARTESANTDKSAPMAGIRADGTARGAFFIGNTIANLRSTNPSPLYSCRTLTLGDGRQVVVDGQGHPSVRQRMPAQPDKPYYFLYQPSDPSRDKDPRVDVWLLKADGTQILGARYTCEYSRADLAKPRPHVTVSYEFPLASTDQAVAAAIRIDDRYFIEKLQQPGR